MWVLRDSHQLTGFFVQPLSFFTFRTLDESLFQGVLAQTIAEKRVEEMQRERSPFLGELGWPDDAKRHRHLPDCSLAGQVADLKLVGPGDSRRLMPLAKERQTSSRIVPINGGDDNPGSMRIPLPGMAYIL